MLMISKMQENNFRQRACPYIPINKFRGFTATFGKISLETLSQALARLGYKIEERKNKNMKDNNLNDIYSDNGILVEYLSLKIKILSTEKELLLKDYLNEKIKNKELKREIREIKKN